MQPPAARGGAAWPAAPRGDYTGGPLRLLAEAMAERGQESGRRGFSIAALLGGSAAHAPAQSAYNVRATMLRQLLRRFGVARMSAALTVISVVASLLITTALTYAMGGGGPGRDGLILATVVPLVVAPLMSWQMLALLFRLDRAEERLRGLSITDELTQAYNRRYFIALAEAELARIRRYGGTCSLAILDLDNFKQVNDTRGHLAGDETLRQFSRLCRANLRVGDTFARYGGDEFVLLLPSTSPQAGREVVDRIRAMLAAGANGRAADGAAAPDDRLSLSAGIAGLDPAVPDLDQLVKRADDALFAAKRAGGNRVVD